MGLTIGYKLSGRAGLKLSRVQRIVSALRKKAVALDFEHVGRLLETHSLKGRSMLVTAGPTREPLDPVRFLSNYSSGKMGVAIAAAASSLRPDA